MAGDMAQLLRAKLGDAADYVQDALVHTLPTPLTDEEATALRAELQRLSAAIEAYIKRSGSRPRGHGC